MQPRKPESAPRPTPHASRLWSQARSQILLDEDVTNLNTGSFGPLPRVVFERVTELRRRLAEEPMDFLVRQAPGLLWGSRESLSAYLGADPHRLLFTANVTAAINLVAASLRLAAPGEILLTDHEYGAMHWCWERAAQRQGLSLRLLTLPTMPSSPEAIIAAACAAFSPRTRLFFFSHIISPTGMVLPVRQLCAEARTRRILTVIDGAHAPALVPLNLSELSCDFYAGNCHKWLLAPTGSGFLYFGEESMERVEPLQVSWGWHRQVRSVSEGRLGPDERDEHGSTPRLRALEFEGTRDLCPWLSVPAAIKFQQDFGPALIRSRIEELSAHVRQRLGRDMGFAPATPAHPELHSAMTAFWLSPETDAARLRGDIWHRYRTEIPVIERPDGLLIRVSTHFYNTEDEIDHLAGALQELGVRGQGPEGKAKRTHARSATEEHTVTDP